MEFITKNAVEGTTAFFVIGVIQPSLLFNFLPVLLTIKYTVSHITRYATIKMAVKISTTAHSKGIHEFTR